MAGVLEPLDADGRTRARGSLMRGWHRALEARGLRERVAARLTPAVATLLREPPLGTAWVDVAHFECVAQAVLEELGEPELDRLFLVASTDGWSALLTRFVGGLVRAFDPDPHFILKQVPAAARLNTEGMEVEWRVLGDRAGELVATYTHRPRIYPASAWGTRAAVLATAAALGRALRVERPVIEASKGGMGATRVRVGVAW